MANLWSLGGLSWPELIKRTWRETWQDAVFGQAARLAFYHFLAIFPSLLLLFLLLVKLEPTGSELRQIVLETFRQILPPQVSGMIEGTINELNGRTNMGIAALPVVLSAVWAAVNGTWAMITGLNTAYEVQEKRRLWKILGLAFGLTVSLAVMCLLSLLIILYGTRAAQIVSPHFGAHPQPLFLLRIVQWPVLMALLLAAFALLYRFGPNAQDRRWQWSTPGAVLALILWLIATFLLREYFARFHSHEQIYGHLNTVVMLLMWFYFTGAAVLIGGELNSEIEKAVEPRRTAS